MWYKMIDVAIVGAGPAGWSAADILAKKDFKVTIFEKEKLPRYKSCGVGVAIRCLRSLYQLEAKIKDFSLQEDKGFTLIAVVPNVALMFVYFD